MKYIFGSLGIVELQVQPLGGEGLREEVGQVGHLDLQVLDPNEVDVQVRVELAHELPASPARAAEVSIQIGGNGYSRKFIQALETSPESGVILIGKLRRSGVILRHYFVAYIQFV